MATEIVMVEVKRSYRAQFSGTGLVVGGSWAEEIDSPDPKKVVWPDSAYCFMLYEHAELILDDGLKCSGSRWLDKKRYYHPDSVVTTLEEVKAGNTPRRPGDALVGNMEANGWKEVVWSRWGNWPQPFDRERDVVLERDENA